MNTKNLKSYAPKARKQFIEAVKKRAAHFSIYEDRIEEVRIEGGAAIIEGRAFTRKEGEQRKRLESKVTERGYEMFIREMAYTWFNRLAAIRYMEIHDYFDHGFRVLSHPTNQGGLPEILNHASDVAESLNLDKDHIIELQLAGDKEEELYRELLLGQCHQLAKIMPQIFKGLAFESIDDATELLLPNNLIKTDSILKGIINDIPEEDWQEIEVIGWLYQFYISEHKDAVIGKVVKSEDIPAATQLFTPNWIVKYLVQNSVGRQWLATYPDSELKSKMEYYIEPAEQSDDVIEQLKEITPTSIDPEEIKVLDPACGSGHILVEVYEVLREIYLERGYRLREIPELILTKNIYGLDIDDRAAQLAGFALMMKAREDDRRIFQRVEEGEVSLNVLSLQSTEHLDIPRLWKALDLEGNQQTGSTGGLFDESEGFVQPTGIYKEYFELLQYLKSSFLQAKTIGSLIQIDNQYLDNLVSLKKLLQKKREGSDPAAISATSDLIPTVNQAIVLARTYDAVVANPPYMGSNGMNTELKKFAKVNYPDSKSDLFSVYIEKCLAFTAKNGSVGMVTPYVWMFIGSYEKLRKKVLNQNTLRGLIQLEYNAFAPACIPVCSYIIDKSHLNHFTGSYIRLSDFKGHEQQAPRTLEAINNNDCGWYFKRQPSNFNAIPGAPIGYWLDDSIFSIFEENKNFKDVCYAGFGIKTGNNEVFMREWTEVNTQKLCLTQMSDEPLSNKKWFPCASGGKFRKWYGNQNLIVDYEMGGKNIECYAEENGNSFGFNGKKYYFLPSITWPKLTSSFNSFRSTPAGNIFDGVGLSAFFNSESNYFDALALLNSNIYKEFIAVLAPTLSFTSGDFLKLPFVSINCADEVKELVNIHKVDWDSSEMSFNFVRNSLISNQAGSVSESFRVLSKDYSNIVERVRNLESTINQKVLKALNVEENSLLIDIPIEQISLSINDHYAFGKADQNRRRAEVFIDFIKYSLGCMMGRYSLDCDGLVYAQSNNYGFKELAAEGAYKTFPADDDGIIPLAFEEWLFDDDATTRFKEFVKTVWGNETLDENLEFVAESLCLHALKPKKGEGAMDTIRRYFSTQFFKDHCKTYKKRPIYWLFSSGKEKAFECLVYLHRYNEGTLSRMRTEYVTPLMGKYEAQHTLLSEQQLQATGTEARSIEKDLKSLEKKQAELRTFDEQLKHYAEKRITLDLDDGVKANYGKFGNLLADVKAIHGKAVE
mgnify:CR=1 FL=1